MTSSEKKIEKKLRLGIESLGGLCLKLPSTFFAGLPDRLCLLPGGLAFFVETKGEGLQLRPRQLYVARKLEGLGFRVYVANSEALVDELVSACRNEYAPAETPKRSFTAADEAELAELETARVMIVNNDPTDDLNAKDLYRYYALKAKKAFFNQ